MQFILHMPVYILLHFQSSFGLSLFIFFDFALSHSFPRYFKSLIQFDSMFQFAMFVFVFSFLFCKSMVLFSLSLFFFIHKFMLCMNVSVCVCESVYVVCVYNSGVGWIIHFTLAMCCVLHRIQFSWILIIHQFNVNFNNWNYPLLLFFPFCTKSRFSRAVSSLFRLPSHLLPFSSLFLFILISLFLSAVAF